VNESALFRGREAGREAPGCGLDGEPAPPGVPGEDGALVRVRRALLRVELRGGGHRGDVRGGALGGGPELGDVLVHRAVRGEAAEEGAEVLCDHGLEDGAVPLDEVVEVVDVHAPREAGADDGDDGGEELGGGGHREASVACAGDGMSAWQGPTTEASVTSADRSRRRASPGGSRECGATGQRADAGHGSRSTLAVGTTKGGRGAESAAARRWVTGVVDERMPGS
jgi:hypothetical protein